jgi:hypothetical protein
MYYEGPMCSNVIIMHLGEGTLHANKMINARSLKKKCVDVEFAVLLFKKRRTCDYIECNNSYVMNLVGAYFLLKVLEGK